MVFHLHRPQTLADWRAAPTLDAWVKESGAYTSADDTKPSTLRSRLRAMPELERGQLYPDQLVAITSLEMSLQKDKPRALVQMATGSGKTLTSVAAICRMIKFGGARACCSDSRQAANRLAAKLRANLGARTVQAPSISGVPLGSAAAMPLRPPSPSNRPECGTCSPRCLTYAWAT